MSAADQTIPPPSSSRRAKDLAFRLTLLACLGISIRFVRKYRQVYE